MTTVIDPAPSSKTTSTAPPARVCAKGCGKSLSYNNTTGICSDCQKPRSHSKKTNGHNGTELHPEPFSNVKKMLAALPAGRNAEEAANARRLESRVDILLAAVPQADKAKLLNAWLSGAL